MCDLDLFVSGTRAGIEKGAPFQHPQFNRYCLFASLRVEHNGLDAHAATARRGSRLALQTHHDRDGISSERGVRGNAMLERIDRLDFQREAASVRTSAILCQRYRKRQVARGIQRRLAAPLVQRRLLRRRGLLRRLGNMTELIRRVIGKPVRSRGPAFHRPPESRPRERRTGVGFAHDLGVRLAADDMRFFPHRNLHARLRDARLEHVKACPKTIAHSQ